jgi:uncharacterized phage protein gp47/JayE
MLRTLKYAYESRDKVANVLPGSDHYYRFQSLSYRLGVIVANNQISNTQNSPLTATGDYLDDLAGVFGVIRRIAVGASGFVDASVTTAVTIPADFYGVAEDGLRYGTTRPFTTGATSGEVEVQAVDTGADTNQDAGTIITWESAAIGSLYQTALVGSNGLTGGSDADTDEELRTRLLNALSFPGIGGNAANNREWAEEASAGVDQASVFSAVRGPASYDIAVASTDGDRTLSTTIVSQVAGYVSGKMPGHSSINVTTVDPEEVDVVLYAKLPLPVHGGGAGGGWYDATPWPASPNYGYISAISAPDITVTSTTTPSVGTHISIWNSTDEEFTDFVITATGGSPPNVTIQVSPAIPAWLAVGAFISAGAQSMADYGTAFIAAMRQMGAGEKTDNIDLLPRSLRHPPPDVAFPYALTSVQLTAVTTGRTEILDLSYGLRIESGSFGAPVVLTEPSLPTLTADPPKILVLKEFSIVSS